MSTCHNKRNGPRENGTHYDDAEARGSADFLVPELFAQVLVGVQHKLVVAEQALGSQVYERISPPSEGSGVASRIRMLAGRQRRVIELHPRSRVLGDRSEVAL